MRSKSFLLLGLALGCGLVASIGISQVMDRKTVQPAAPETEAILVALKDINLAEPLTADLLKLEEWPKDKIPPDALRKLEEVVDRRTRTKIYAGEPIREAKLISANGGDAPSEQIAAGYRVVAVQVDAAAGGAGLAKPGDRVDVQLFVSKSDRNGIEQSQVRTILEDVKVFAVDQSFRRSAEAAAEGTQVADTISLLVTPQQAEALYLAIELGKIRLTLRHPDDDSNVENQVTTTEDLFHTSKSNREDETASVEEPKDDLGDFANELAAVEPQDSFVMQIFEGSAAREVEFVGKGRLPQEIGGDAPAVPEPTPPPAAPPAATPLPPIDGPAIDGPANNNSPNNAPIKTPTADKMQQLQEALRRQGHPLGVWGD